MPCLKFHIVQENTHMGGRVGSAVKGTVALVKDQGSIPSTHMTVYNYL